MTANQQPQLVRLPDARRLAFADYGPPDGVPCIVLAGMPGSRLAPAWAFPEGLLAQRGVRLVGVDRPGYGRSDPNPGTSTLGVADDLGVLCEVVGLDRFAVLGISVGAPFAMACAVRFPDRVGSLLLSSPMGPWELPETRAGMSRRNRRYFTLTCREDAGAATPAPGSSAGGGRAAQPSPPGRWRHDPGAGHRAAGQRQDHPRPTVGPPPEPAPAEQGHSWRRPSSAPSSSPSAAA